MRNVLTTSHSLPPSLENVEIDNYENNVIKDLITKEKFKNSEFDPLFTKQESFKKVNKYFILNYKCIHNISVM